jgi:hypothetical protein
MKYALTCLAGLMTAGIALPVWAIEYRLEGDVAAYRWVEDLESIEVKESGPVFQFGGYVSGFPYLSGSPSESAAAMTLRGDLRVLVGQVDYDGFNQDLGTGALTPTTTDTTYLGITPEASIGLRQGVESGYLEPFIGLGYRWWWRDIGGDTGYPEYYNLIYSRLGLRIEHGLSGNLKLHSTFSVDPVLWARETIDLTESAFFDSGGALVQGQRFTVENGLRPGWTIEVGLRQAKVDLTGYWQAVRLDESNSVTCYDSVDPTARRSCFQPESHQDIFGLRVGLAF